jgi:acetolactate synthase-1/2/3 large subunit
MITGQKPIKKSKQGRFQIVDIVSLMKPITKYAIQIAAGDNIPSRVREAIRLAEEEKPGAVHLEFPEDIAEEHTSSRPIPASLARRPSAEEKAVRQAVLAIEGAKAPILVIGAGANRKLTGRMLRQLIDKTGIPFVTTQMGKGVVDERHPLFLGCAALTILKSFKQALYFLDGHGSNNLVVLGYCEILVHTVSLDLNLAS